MVQQVFDIAYMLRALLPDTSEKIFTLIKNKQKPEKPLFLRKD
jgi:hypothetical protein